MPIDPVPQSPIVIQDHQLVDSVVYLASLSSSVKAIDHQMDTLRSVTSRWDGESPLKELDRTELLQLADWLKEYLINSDTLREFTKASLDERLQTYLRHDTTRTPRVSFQSVIVVAVLAALLVFAIPYTPSLTTRALLASPAFLVVGVIGVVWLYLSSLANFKPELRRAFLYICAGTVTLGIFFVHFVLVQLFAAGEQPLFRYGGFVALGACSIIFMYWGLVLAARLLGYTSRFMSLRVYGASLAATTVLSALVASIRPTAQPAYFGFTFACLLALTVSALFGAKVAQLIYRGAAAAYVVSIRWFYIFMLGTFLGSTAYETALLVLGHLSGAPLSASLGLFAIPPLLLLLYTGHSFKKETSR
ncbi:MAG TPA: hypothetical protein VGO07_00475 [Candidatus Saccharimonadales bacterium]|jgi:hypothetical protein|nr:hypothetical protein [Candidatus Saccharimonadales bacterium]